LDAAGNTISVDPTNKTLPVQDFRLFCNTNWPTSVSSENPGIHDILKVYAPDLTTCITLCAEYNEQYQTSLNNGIDVGGGFCKVATITKKQGGFCYLRNGTGTTNDTFGTPSDYTSAVLFAPGQIAGLSS
jgi:acetamidase/formamidase